jgi:DNA helicase IV
MPGHPDLEAEQAYIDNAYACLEATREAASRMTSMVEVGRGGTNQARYERDVIWDTMLQRLSQLQLGDASLCFGRIDFASEAEAGRRDAADRQEAADRHDAAGPNGSQGTGSNGSHGSGDATGAHGSNGSNGSNGANGSTGSPLPAAAADGARAAAYDGNGHDPHLDHIDDHESVTPIPDPGPSVGERGGSYYIGRIAVSDENQEPVIVDWRAPVAEPFYRATGRQPMGLSRRRHFATRGRALLSIEDELFGDAVTALGLTATADLEGQGDGEHPTIRGQGSLFAALETTRTGKLGDIVATIQGEQDEIIRAPMPGVLVVQGGPGTGKTVVALHRAAYLLYTYRFPLEGQGVLVVGPNRLFLGYIEQVLPSLGEAGVELAVLADLVPDVAIQGFDRDLTARVKGDLRMAKFLVRAVHDRELPLRDDLVIGYGLQHLRVTVAQSRHIVDEARRRFRKHNAGRKFVEAELYNALAASGRGDLEPSEVRERLRHTLEVRAALERMWPVLTPAELLHDLYGARSLLEHAARNLLRDDEWRALHRARDEHVDDVVWTNDDGPLLDEAFAILGPKPKSRKQRQAAADAGMPPDDEVRTYGHIVVDEAQDLSPMQLRMLNRRSLNGSMTIVGDIAQSTGQWAHANWQEILDQLPGKRAPRRAELTIGYRLPAPNMALAARVLRFAAPDLKPPTSIREDGDVPRILRAESLDARHLGQRVVEGVRGELDAVGLGNVAVIVPWSLVDIVDDALTAAGIAHGRATRHGLDQQVTVVPVGLVKGLELDASVVVEPAAIVDEEPQGLRSLYVALTRATKRLAIVHARDLPVELRE